MEKTKPIPGEWENWAARWEHIRKSDNACLYSPGTPATSSGRYLRGYYGVLRGKINGKQLRCCELGAGRGTTSQYLAADGHKVVLVDLAENGLEIARQNWKRYQMAAPECVVRDVADTGLSGGVFDLVHSVGLLEHFEDPRPVLKESMRLLKSGGLMFHVIVTGRNNGIYRTEHGAADYERFMTDLGFESEASDMIVSGVLRLVAWSPR